MPPERHRFHTTHWSLVVAAGHAPTTEARKALSRLCEIYWYPLYAFVRRQGQNAENALDLTQGFFTRLLEKKDIASADQSRGRFRSWLLAAMKHFMANEYYKNQAQKRGGGKRVLSFEMQDAEDRYRLEPSHEMTPERIFDRRWALTILEQVLRSLEEQMKRAGKQKQFEKLKAFLTTEDSHTPYARIAVELSMSEGAVKVAVHRLRRKYRELLTGEIANTVDSQDDVPGEIEHLLACLGE